jgi:hypothetical protein
MPNFSLQDFLNHNPVTSKEAKRDSAKIEKSLLQSAQELVSHIKATNAKLETSIRLSDIALGKAE